MIFITPDHRKSNVLLLIGIIFLGLISLSINSDQKAITIVATFFLTAFGITYLAVGLFYRYIIKLNNDVIIIKNRVGLFEKQIARNEIAQVKVVDRKYPITAYNNTSLHLFLWDKKFSYFKEVHLFDTVGKKVFTIDGQAIDNNDFANLVKALKK